jgi:hypothetical protein
MGLKKDSTTQTNVMVNLSLNRPDETIDKE